MSKGFAIRSLTALVAVAVFTPLFASASLAQDTRADDAKRVIVGLRTSFTPEGRANASDAGRQRAAIRSDQDRLEDELRGSRYQVKHRHETIPFVSMHVGEGALERLKRSSMVKSIEPDEQHTPTLAKSTQIVRATTAASWGLTGSGQNIAIVDTGVETSHTFLTGALKEEFCFAQDASCPNGQVTMAGPGAAKPCPWSRCDHGTHVAGIALGREVSYKGTAMRGVAQRAGLIAMRVFSSKGCATTPCAFSSDIVAALERVHQMKDTYKIAAVNMSLGGGTVFATRAACDQANPSRKAIIDTLRNDGIATVVAAGNGSQTGGLSAPACISSAISVGATTKQDTVASYSNSAGYLDLLAPGSSILSSVPTNGMAAKNGTSMAAPHVAGAWADLKQRYPSASVDSVLGALRRGGLTITDSRNGVQTPRIDVLSGSQHLRTFHVNDRSLWENGGAAVFTITLGAPEPFSVGVNWQSIQGDARYEEDFKHVSGRVVFSPGETRKTVSVPLVNDAIREGTEQFAVELRSPAFDPVAGKMLGIGTILDDDGGCGCTWHDNDPVFTK